MRVHTNFDTDPLNSSLDFSIKREFCLPLFLSTAYNFKHMYIRIDSKLYILLGLFGSNVCVKEVGSNKPEEFLHRDTSVYTSYNKTSPQITKLVNKYYDQSSNNG